MSRPEQDNYKKEGGLVLGLSMYRRQTLANYTVVYYHSLHVLKVRFVLALYIMHVLICITKRMRKRRRCRRMDSETDELLS